MASQKLIQQGYEAIAQGLREFGYPDATSAMVEDTHKALLAGEQIPHGIVGMFAESYLRDAPTVFGDIP